LLFAPVEDELLSLHYLQERPSHLLRLTLLSIGERGSGTHEQVVDGELFLIEALRQRATFFFVELLRELDELQDERLDVDAPRVVVVEQLLEPLHRVGTARIEGGHGEDPCLHGGAWPLRLGLAFPCRARSRLVTSSRPHRARSSVNQATTRQRDARLQLLVAGAGAAASAVPAHAHSRGGRG
jgi:hypothetical protein